MTTDDRDDAEISSRLERIATDLELLVKEITPKLIRYGHLRKEADDLLSELRSRHAVVEHREGSSS